MWLEGALVILGPRYQPYSSRGERPHLLNSDFVLPSVFSHIEQGQSGVWVSVYRESLFAYDGVPLPPALSLLISLPH